MSALDGGMTWENIRRAYLDAGGNSTAAGQEAFAHLTQGFRHVVNGLDTPEVYGEAELDVGTDPLEDSNSSNPYLAEVELDCNVQSIHSVYNITVGAPVYADPGGMRGRDRYLNNVNGPNPKPPAGEVRWFVPFGRKIYLRDAPSTATRLRVRYRIAIEPITDLDLERHPFTPAQFDWAIVWSAAANYYRAHRDQNMVQGQPPLSDYYAQQSMMAMAEPKTPDAENEKATLTPMRLAGYMTTPRSRRR